MMLMPWTVQGLEVAQPFEICLFVRKCIVSLGFPQCFREAFEGLVLCLVRVAGSDQQGIEQKCDASWSVRRYLFTNGEVQAHVQKRVRLTAIR